MYMPMENNIVACNIEVEMVEKLTKLIAERLMNVKGLILKM